MRNLTPSQQKIIVVTVVVILAFFALWLILYIPAINRMNQYKIELLGIQNQIQQIEVTVAQNKSIEEGMRLLTTRYQQLDSKFPAKEEQGLKLLSDIAHQLNVEVVSTKFQPKREFQGAGEKIQIEGKTCQELTITLDLKATYKDLVGYIKTLKEELPVFVTFDDLRINRSGSIGESQVSATLTLNFYLLS